MKLLKSGLLIALLVLFCAGTANAQPFSWYWQPIRALSLSATV